MIIGLRTVFNLHCPDGPVELRENYKFSRRKLRHIGRALTKHLNDLCESWERIQGVE
jgi:hypothetical protein